MPPSVTQGTTLSAWSTVATAAACSVLEQANKLRHCGRVSRSCLACRAAAEFCPNRRNHVPDSQRDLAMGQGISGPVQSLQASETSLCTRTKIQAEQGPRVGLPERVKNLYRLHVAEPARQTPQPSNLPRKGRPPPVRRLEYDTGIFPSTSLFTWLLSPGHSSLARPERPATRGCACVPLASVSLLSRRSWSPSGR